MRLTSYIKCSVNYFSRDSATAGSAVPIQSTGQALILLLRRGPIAKHAPGGNTNNTPSRDGSQKKRPPHRPNTSCAQSRASSKRT